MVQCSHVIIKQKSCIIINRSKRDDTTTIARDGIFRVSTKISQHINSAIRPCSVKN